MRAEAEAADLLRMLAAPGIPGERVAAAIHRAARKAGMNFARARKCWYGQAATILASEMDSLRRAARNANAGGHEVELTNAYSELFAVVDDLRAQIAILNARMARGPLEGEGDPSHG